MVGPEIALGESPSLALGPPVLTAFTIKRFRRAVRDHAAELTAGSRHCRGWDRNHGTREPAIGFAKR
jgi:hypothetical protein